MTQDAEELSDEAPAAPATGSETAGPADQNAASADWRIQRPPLHASQLLVVAILLAIGIAVILLPEQADLASLRNAGEPYHARILRDSYGVPHVYGVTDADASYGLAYAHAEDDFLTIQQSLAAARGQLAAIYGRDSAPIDYLVQLLRIWDTVDANYETQLTPQTRALLDAYAAGLNQYAALHEDQVISPKLFPVSGKDIVAASVQKSPLFFGLDQTLTELFAGERQSAVSPQPRQARWVENRYGSNTFAIGPGRTPDGSTYLAVNSHQPWEGPVAWYEAHVHSEQGWDMTGALFPGSPVIIHGHNRRLGWAFTVNHPDLTDVYVLEINPDNPNQYRFDGQWRDLEVRRAVLRVKLVGRLRIPISREALWSVYGPVVRQPHGVYAIRYAGMDRVDIWQQLYRMNKATSFEQWRAAMAEGGLPSFNVGYADADGNIFYLYNGLLPVRAEGYDWSLYLPGDTSDTLWTEILPFDRLPQVLNPPSGFVQNANSTPFRTTTGPGNPDPGVYSPTLGIDTNMSNRALRALEQFDADPSITFDEFIAYKYDMSYSAQSDVPRMIELIAGAQLDDPDLRAGADLLRQWDLRTNPENDAAALGVATIYYLAEVAGFDSSMLAGNDFTQAQAVEALGKAVALLKTHFGRLDVPWGNVNRLRRGAVDLGVGGGPDVLHAVYGEQQEDGTLTGTAGDSYVQVSRWQPGGQVESYSIHQYGSATLDAASPHYADQAPIFVQRQLKPAWFDESDVRAHLEREYRPGEPAPLP